jgi:hypothetical protein
MFVRACENWVSTRLLQTDCGLTIFVRAIGPILEHIVITDPTPAAPQVVIDGEKFEGGPAVRAGE